jgi:hypothetical protein
VCGRVGLFSAVCVCVCALCVCERKWAAHSQFVVLSLSPAAGSVVPRMLILNVDFVTRNALKGIILSCVFEGLCPVDGPDRCCGL